MQTNIFKLKKSIFKILGRRVSFQNFKKLKMETNDKFLVEEVNFQNFKVLNILFLR